MRGTPSFTTDGFAILAKWLGPGWAELTLVSGSFCVGYLKRFGVLGGGIGSQLFIGQLLAYGATVVIADLGTVALAVGLAILASVVPRTLSGPAEQPALLAQLFDSKDETITPEFMMALQAAVAAVAIVMLGKFVGLTQSAWAIAACTYVLANTTAGTIDRIKLRIAGALIGVPLALACLQLSASVSERNSSINDDLLKRRCLSMELLPRFEWAGARRAFSSPIDATGRGGDAG
jgi:hypothetical protein